MPENHFEGEIVVASRIVDYLSSGLYEKPSASLRELINNSYDADATEVEVFVKPDADRIIVADNGIGMTQEEFVRHFSRISESYKREETDVTEKGRPKIGKIGIGFIAANEICDVMKIHTTKEGSKNLVKARINFKAMREKSFSQRKKSDDEIKKGDYEGTIDEAKPEKHYTRIFLEDIQGDAKGILQGAKQGPNIAGETSLYGLSASSIKEEILTDESFDNWQELDTYSQTFLDLGLNVPVPYYEDWIPGEKQFLLERKKEVEDLEFRVNMDGTEIKKPIVFSPEDEENILIKKFTFSGEEVSANGYMYAQHTKIKPQELQGLLIRIREAAIGEYDAGFMNFSSSENSLMQTWTSAELWPDDRLEEAMNIDRRTLRTTHPAYRELQNAFHDQLSDFLKEVRNNIYGSQAKVRKREKAKNMVISIEEVADQEISKVDKKTAESVKKSWDSTVEDEAHRKRLLKRYNVSQLYKLIVKVADKVLEEETAAKFLRELTKRLEE